MYNFIRKKIIHEAHMLFQYLCGFKPIFYFTHPNEEPVKYMKSTVPEYRKRHTYGLLELIKEPALPKYVDGGRARSA